MRKTLLFLAGMLSAGMASSGVAEQPSAGSLLTGVQPRNITFKTVDVAAANKALPSSNLLKPTSKPGIINMGNSFPKLTLGSWPPKIASLSVLTGKQNPYQPNPIVGQNPFSPSPAKK